MPCLPELPSHSFLIVDHQPDVPYRVGGLPTSCHEREELVAHVDEGRPRADSATQIEGEEAPVPVKGLADVCDFERHVIDSHQTSHARDTSSVPVLQCSPPIRRPTGR